MLLIYIWRQLLSLAGEYNEIDILIQEYLISSIGDEKQNVQPSLQGYLLRHSKGIINEYQSEAFKTDCTTNARGMLISRGPHFDGHVRRNSLLGNNKTFAPLPSFLPFFRPVANMGDKAIKLWSRAKRETARDVSVDCLSFSSILFPFLSIPPPLSTLLRISSILSLDCPVLHTLHFIHNIPACGFIAE